MGPGPVPGCGWQLILTHPSPNFGPRRDGARPDLVVIHYTAMHSADAACRTLCNPATEVSAHYLIDEDGTVRSLVDEAMRAWHAGAGQWGEVSDVNSRSIGIELSNTGAVPFAQEQMAALLALLGAVQDRWGMRPERFIGHSDMAPGRKIDPGPWFDWEMLAKQGFGVWFAGSSGPYMPASRHAFRQMAERFGYRCADDEVLLQAFRLRFRPRVTGPVDTRDLAIITDLATRFPVDAKPPTA